MSTNELLSITLIKRQVDTVISNIDVIPETQNSEDTVAPYNVISTIGACVDTTNGSDTISIGGVEKDILGNGPTSMIDIITAPSQTYKNLGGTTVTNIKEVIYLLHHRAGGVTGGGTSGGEGGDVPPIGGDGGEVPPEGGDGTTGDDDIPPADKKTFINAAYNSFNDTETMFDYLHTVDSSITLETGITRKQLLALTQNDAKEDANDDFFGSLNRVFYKIDTNNDGKLSFDELKAVIGTEIGESKTAWESKINSYASQLQTQYMSLSAQGKLDFAIQKTRDYLTAMGMTDQITVLNRLLSQTDLYAGSKMAVKGNIGIKDLNPGYTSGPYTLGAYSFWAGSQTYTNYNPNLGTNFTQKVSYWAGDEDVAGGSGDVGITLDKKYLDGSWVELVETLVHELTHATASTYYTLTKNRSTAEIHIEQVEKLHDAGILNETDYAYISANIDEIIYYVQEWYDVLLSFVQDTNPNATEVTPADLLALKNNGTLDEGQYNFCVTNLSKMKSLKPYSDKLYYLCATMWGEYSAYQTGADYMDSMAADVYDKSPSHDFYVDGDKEKDAIISHIDNCGYNAGGNEVMPDWKWWSYNA